MQFSVKQSELSRALASASKVAPSRSTLPVLANVLLDAAGETLKICATNLEQGVILEIPAKVTEQVAFTLPCRTLTDLVATFAGEIEFTLNVKTMTCHLKAGGSKADVKGIDAQEFPSMGKTQGQLMATFKSADFAKAVKQVAMSASTDEARPVLEGVKMEFGEDRATFAAADGFRLAIKSIDYVDATFGGGGDAIIPAKAMTWAAGLCNGADVQVYADKSRVTFDVGNGTVFMSQIVEGQFPDYWQIVPRQSKVMAHIETSKLALVCKQAEIFAREGSHIIKFTFDPTAGTVAVSGQSDESGNSNGIVEGDVSGDPLTIAFNATYFTQALSVIDASTTAIEASVNNAPAVIKPEGDRDTLFVVMPMHLD